MRNFCDIGVATRAEVAAVNGGFELCGIDKVLGRRIAVAGEAGGIIRLCPARGGADETRQPETGKQDPV